MKEIIVKAVDFGLLLLLLIGGCLYFPMPIAQQRNGPYAQPIYSAVIIGFMLLVAFSDKLEEAGV